jgi:hypothetical protein
LSHQCGGAIDPRRFPTGRADTGHPFGGRRS